MHEERQSLIERLLDFLNPEGNAEAIPPQRADDKETARQIKRFIDEIPGGFLIYRARDERILYANAALCRIYGCASQEEFMQLTKGSFRGMVHPDDLENVEQSIEEQIKGSCDALDYVEYRILDKSGSVRWLEDYGHFVHGEKEDIFYVFLTDATEKVTRIMLEKAELISEKREKEQKLQNLIEEYDKERKLIRQEHLQRLEVIEGLSVNYDSILYIDLDSDQALPYRLSSRLKRQFQETLQARDYNGFLKDYVATWVHPDDKELVAERVAPDYIRKTLKELHTYYLNYRCVEGEEISYLQIRLVDVGGKDHVSQVVLGCRRVDEEVEHEMRQKQFLEQALRAAKLAEIAKNTFLSNMSHDLRTPLNAIFGFTALAEKSAGDESAVKNYLSKIETAGNQILDLIDKVLEISYAESQEIRLSESDCDLLALARDAYESVLPNAERKSLSFKLFTNGLRHAHVVCDGDRLRQMVVYLLNNAIKFTKQGGSASLTVTEEADAYKFIVSDTGIGIAAESLQRIFEPFEREQNTTLSGVYGMGLGLPLAKRIAESMGGRIEVVSELGKGSTFTAVVPLKRKKGAPEEKTTRLPESLRGKKVLVVEDNEINLEIETELLEELGFAVETAENGQIAVEKMKRAAAGEFAFVLMDIQMPVMDGRQAAREIRKLPAGTLPIVALSANAFESDKRLSAEAGMNAHLTKPVDVPLLVETISALV